MPAGPCRIALVLNHNTLYEVYLHVHDSYMQLVGHTTYQPVNVSVCRGVFRSFDRKNKSLNSKDKAAKITPCGQLVFS